MEIKEIRLKPGKERSIERRHPWVFSGALVPGHENLPDGTVVHLLNSSKQVIATGFYSPSSIAVRILHFGKMTPDQDFFDRALAACFSLRNQLGLVQNVHTNCYRLSHGEGDGFPGLVVDVYGHTAVVQCHIPGYLPCMHMIAKAIIKNADGRIRFVYLKSKEILGQKQEMPDGFIGDSGETSLEVTENGRKFKVDIATGQKTGFFLDQRNNRDLLAQYSKGKKVLNTFSYSGGFSVYALTAGATQVTSVDISKKAIELCDQNIALNGGGEHTSVVADVVDYIKEVGNDYDIIVLDPPAFAKHLSARHKAVIGYKRINAEAIKRIKKGGLIFTFSCSQAVDAVLFESTVCAAAIEAGRNVRILHRMSQPADHPVSIFHPEGHYLKGLVIHVD